MTVELDLFFTIAQHVTLLRPNVKYTTNKYESHIQ